MFRCFAWLALAAIMTACGAADMTSTQDCENACASCDDACLDCTPDFCATVPPGWDGPSLLWSGREDDAPECPSGTTVVYEGRSELGDAHPCPVCTCSTPVCGLPWGATVSSWPICHETPPGTLVLEVAAPEGWDGSCMASSIVPSDTMQSYTKYGPAVQDCEPMATDPSEQSPPVWKTLALACGEPASDLCPAAGRACTGPASHRFLECVHRSGGDLACPPEYTRRHVFFESLDDDRGCSPCTCGPPEEPSCLSMLGLYRDSECMNYFSYSVCDVGSMACAQFWVPDFRSMAGRLLPEADPGACAPSGGEPVGDATPAEPTTFCCRAPAEL